MPRTNRRTAQRSIYKKNVEKLQRAGLLGEVDFRKKATPAIIRRIEKYKSVISGKAAVVKAPDLETARKLRKTLGLKGSGKTLVVPREKGERYTIKKTTGEIVSTRKGYNKGEIIHKTLGSRFKPRNPDDRAYYTIPERIRGAGRIKRKTFASFDEMLYYLSKYEIDFEDIEDRIEIEYIGKGSRRDKARQKVIHDERAAAAKRYKRRNARNKSKRRPGGPR